MESVFRHARRTRVQGGGATVLLSSHILSEVEQLCDRVTIVRAGKAVETGSLTDLRHLTRTQRAGRDTVHGGADLGAAGGARRDGRTTS